MRTNNQKGISLIVLVITIVIMIILASAIILTLSSNGIIGKARHAKRQSDLATMREAGEYFEAEYLLGVSDGSIDPNATSIKSYVEVGLTNKGYSLDDIVVTEEGKVTAGANIIKEQIAYEIEDASNGGKITRSKYYGILTSYSKDDTVGLKQNGDEYIITDLGEEIILTGIVDVTVTEDTKTGDKASELYDGINYPATAVATVSDISTTTAQYNANSMHIGDWVEYNAGTWNETKLSHSKNTSDSTGTTFTDDILQQYGFSFGGYTKGGSRNKSVDNDAFTQAPKVDSHKYEGWRIWSIDGDKVTLISGGCPEVYFNPGKLGNGIGRASLRILSGVTASGYIPETAPTSVRDWNNYINVAQYATAAKMLTEDEASNWYRDYVDSSLSEDGLIALAPVPNWDTNKLMSVFRTGTYYWFASIPIDTWTNHGCEQRIIDEGATLSYMSGGTNGIWYGYSNYLGVRILITLDEDVTFIRDTENVVEKDGFEYNIWKIES